MTTGLDRLGEARPTLDDRQADQRLAFEIQLQVFGQPARAGNCSSVTPFAVIRLSSSASAGAMSRSRSARPVV